MRIINEVRQICLQKQIKYLEQQVADEVDDIDDLVNKAKAEGKML